MQHYILNSAGDPEPCDDLTKWSEWYMGNFAGHIIDDRLPNGLRVKTGFIGKDDTLWGTTVYGDKNIVFLTDNYRSKDESIIGHSRAVAWAKTAI